MIQKIMGILNEYRIIAQVIWNDWWRPKQGEIHFPLVDDAELRENASQKDIKLASM